MCASPQASVACRAPAPAGRARASTSFALPHSVKGVGGIVNRHTHVAISCVLALALLAATLMTPALAPAESAGCVFQASPDAVPAFCETFDQPVQNNGTRSGALDGVLWGVSRSSSNDNPSQNLFDRWAATSVSACGSSVPVLPP